MNPLVPGELHRKHYRFDCPAAPLAALIPVGAQACVQVANRIAGLGVMLTLHDLTPDDTRRFLSFPENGLHFAPEEVTAIHGIDLHGSACTAFSLEFAIAGEPRAVSIALTPQESGQRTVQEHLIAFAAGEIDETEYDRWHDENQATAKMCPCCLETANHRRANPRATPLARILRCAAAHKTALRCSILAPEYGFSTWLTPGTTICRNGRIEVASWHEPAVLEIDPGACHSYWIGTERLDGEWFTTMRVFDSHGCPHLQISARGRSHTARWEPFCG
ncbi:MAG: hypothetical protein V4733_09485 [Verrucomicrobiota bacterium]